MDVDAFVVRNLDEQITAFVQVAATMRDTLDATWLAVSATADGPNGSPIVVPDPSNRP